MSAGQVAKRKTPVRDRYRRLDEVKEMVVLKALGEGTYHRDIASQLIEDFDEFTLKDFDSLCKRVESYAKSDKWNIYIDELRVQENVKMLQIPISNRMIRLARLEHEYQRLPAQLLDKVYVSKDGTVIRMYKDLTGERMRILEQARREMENHDGSLLGFGGKASGLIVNVSEANSLMSSSEMLIEAPEDEEEIDVSDIEDEEVE